MLIQADARYIPLADQSVQMVCTSPPYWSLRDYGLPPSIFGDDPLCEHVWGDERLQREEGGWHRWKPNDGRDHNTVETRIDPESHPSQGSFCTLCGAWRGCLGLEPTPSLFIQHLVEIFREVKRVLRDDGQCFINISDSRTKTREWAGIPWRLVFALQADGWRWEDEIIWQKPNPMPGSQTNRCTRSHEIILQMNKTTRAYFDAEAIREDCVEYEVTRRLREAQQGLQSDYTLKVDGQVHAPSPTSGMRSNRRKAEYVAAGRNRRTIWTIPTRPYGGAHFATYPPALVEPCILAGTSARGACPECGAGWERVVEKTPNKERVREPLGKGSAFYASPQGPQLQTRGGNDLGVSVHTTGWRPTCDCTLKTWRCLYCGETLSDGDITPDGEALHCADCDNRVEFFDVLESEKTRPLTSVPCLVLDPFCGSGTTGIVAIKHGREFIGLDLNKKYLHELAQKRLDGVQVTLL